MTSSSITRAGGKAYGFHVDNAYIAVGQRQAASIKTATPRGRSTERSSSRWVCRQWRRHHQQQYEHGTISVPFFEP